VLPCRYDSRYKMSYDDRIDNYIPEVQAERERNLKRFSKWFLSLMGAWMVVLFVGMFYIRGGTIYGTLFFFGTFMAFVFTPTVVSARKDAWSQIKWLVFILRRKRTQEWLVQTLLPLLFVIAAFAVTRDLLSYLLWSYYTFFLIVWPKVRRLMQKPTFLLVRNS
jgi:hypothetical protein